MKYFTLLYHYLKLRENTLKESLIIFCHKTTHTLSHACSKTIDQNYFRDKIKVITYLKDSSGKKVYLSIRLSKFPIELFKLYII